MTELPLPISVKEVLLGVKEMGQLPENETQVREKPRASNLVSCARASAYDMAGVEGTTDWGRDDMSFTQEQGRLAEDITIGGMQMSNKVRVRNRQIELPEAGSVTGHPDGELVFYGPRPDGIPPGWSDVDQDGRKWGFEHKHFGQFGYTKILRGGLFEEAGDIVDQAILYGAGLGWDAVLIAITAQDASVIRRDINRSKNYKDKTKRWGLDLDPNNANPKLMLFAVDLIPLYISRLPILDGRAAALREALAVFPPEAIVPEGDPFWQDSDDDKIAKGSGFPCSYCDHWEKCCWDLQQSDPVVTIPKVRNE